MSDCDTDCAALNISSCTLLEHTVPHLVGKHVVEEDADGCFDEAAYLAQVIWPKYLLTGPGG